METLRDVLQRNSDRGLVVDLADPSLDRYTDQAGLWLEAFEAESQNRLNWPARLIGEHQIQVQDTQTRRWIVLYL